MKLADIIKVDFVQVKAEEELQDLVRHIRRVGEKILLAEKVETFEEFEMAKSLGFVLFQGYFFHRPKLHAGQHLSPLSLSRLQLLGLVHQPEINFQKIADVIKRDVVLSHKLLRIVNSAYYGLSLSITGILHALTILGTEETRKWISFAVLQDSKGDTEHMLSRMALQRGLFMEQLAPKVRRARDKDLFFLFGLFSLADVLMEAPMVEILERTNLAPEITKQLISGKGELVQMLSMLTHYERGEWDEVEEVAGYFRISEETVGKLYMDSLVTASEMI